MQMFTGSDDEDLAQQKSRQYLLEFTDLNGFIQIEVKDGINLSQSTDDDGDVYSTALAEQLRDLLAKHLE